MPVTSPSRRQQMPSSPILPLLLCALTGCTVDRFADPWRSVDAAVGGHADAALETGTPEAGADAPTDARSEPSPCLVGRSRCGDGNRLERCEPDGWRAADSCPLGCVEEDETARCRRLVPLGLPQLESILYDPLPDGGATVDAPCLRLDTSTGQILQGGTPGACDPGTPLRPSGLGVQSGIRFARVGQEAGPMLGVFVARSWQLPAGGRWRASGDGVLVLLATEIVSIAAILHVGANGQLPGPGGGLGGDRNEPGWGQGGGQAGTEQGSFPTIGRSGGGGGGHGGRGGNGGSDDEASGADGGLDYGAALLPLLGGSGGGGGGGDGGGAGGGGGGAVVLAAAERIEVTASGVLTAPGGGGGPGTGHDGGGGGGGSGGRIVLEAPSMTLAGVLAAGGGGGGGADGRDAVFTGANAAPGQPGQPSGARASAGSGARYGLGGAGDGGAGGADTSLGGADGESDSEGGGGGGGGAGRIFVRSLPGGATIEDTAVLSPPEGSGATSITGALEAR